MGLVAITGQPGCHAEHVARIARKLIGAELLTTNRINDLIRRQFGQPVEGRAWPDAVAFLAAPLLTRGHLVLAGDAVHLAAGSFPGSIRVQVVGRAEVRTGLLMVGHNLERKEAEELRRKLDREAAALLERRSGRRRSPAEHFDLTFNCGTLSSENIAGMIRDAFVAAGLADAGPLSPAAESQLLFRLRSRLAQHGLTPPGSSDLSSRSFGHPSEEIFANLLDFYQIAWEYEPRSFPIMWDDSGQMSESFTPDFYLPEFDLYVELTTMKQALVTRKNRKVKLLREIYPHINIQVFYQKDFENLLFKYGLAERRTSVT